MAQGKKSARLVGAEQVVEDRIPEPVVRETKELETLLASGYPDIGTVEYAEQIIAERTKNPALFPFETYQRARAFLEAYHAFPAVIDTDPGWRSSDQSD